MARDSVAPSRALVPFLDLRPSHAELKDALLRDFSRLIDGGVFLRGPEVEEFEEAFAAFCGVSECVGLSSGLDALRIALLASELESGDEVIVPAHTFFATFEAVTQAGGVPVPVDVTIADYNVDAAAAEAALGPRTRFLLPVHLYGQMADVRTLRDISARHGLTLVEDACQAHGASRDGIAAGSAGRAGAFSFYPAKILGAFGDAGALATNDPAVARRARSLREHGQSEKYIHEVVGYTARLDSLQALVLLRKLEFVDAWIAARRNAAGFYLNALEGLGDLVLPHVPRASAPTWHLFVVRTRRVEELFAFLAERGITTARHYPQPPHLSPAYQELGYRAGSFPITETIAKEALSLPLFPGISDEQLETVVDAVTDFFAGG